MRMTLFAPAVALFLFAACSASAQIGIHVETNHRDYLQFENVFVKVTLRNFSGHAVAFGEKSQLKGGLRFELLGPDGGVVSPEGFDESLLKGTIINSGATHKILIPIFKFYNLHDMGVYRVKAFLSHSLFPEVYESNLASFKVSKGMTVWENLVGVPKMDDKNTDDAIATRKFKIVSHFDGDRQLFFLIIEDKDYVYSVKRVGYQMGGVVPKCEIDSLSRLHLLMQLSAKIYIYFLYNTSGQLEKKEVLLKTTTEPNIVRNPETGEVVLVGEKARANIDYEEAGEDAFPDDR